MKRTPWFPLLALFVPAAVHAAEDSFDIGAAPALPAPQPLFLNAIEMGLGYQSADSYHVGRYGGVIAKGPIAILNARLEGGDAWDASTTRFWDADVHMLGADSISLRARYGAQGRWRVEGSYDGFTRAYTDTARTPFLGAGGSTLSLPANWRTGGSSLQFTGLASSLKPLELKVDWKTIGGDFVVVPYSGYELRLHVTHRIREGVRGQSLPFGQEGNYAVGVFFPQPVDYDSNQMNVSLAHVNERAQWSAAYTFSVFTDHLNAVTVPNPYQRSLGTPWSAGAFAGYPFAQGQYSLPPDSTAHQFVLSGAYAVSPKTRVTVRLSYALQRQNDSFLPYTANPQLAVPDALPRASLDGRVRKTHLTVGITSREWDRIDLAASYTFDDRANHTPIDTYNYVANDVQSQPSLVPGASRYIRLNVPHRFTFHQAKAEGGYRVLPRTRVSLAYTGDYRYRTLQQVSYTAEHTLKAKALTTFAIGSAWVAYTFADRSGSRYDDALPWNVSHTQAYLNAAVTNQSIEHPELRKYNLADRVRHEAKTGVTLDATSQLALNISGGYAENRYGELRLGLRHSDSLLFDADISYAPAKDLTASVFYSFERIRFSQHGYVINVDENNPDQRWHSGTRDMAHTVGGSIDWQAMPDKLKLGAAYYLSDGASRMDFQSTPFVIYTVTAPLPDAREITHNVSLTGDYAVTPQAAVRVGYTLQYHRSNDWQYDDIAVAAVPQILGSGIVPPRYTAHIVWVSTRYRF